MNATPVLEGYGVRLVPLRTEHLEELQSTHDESTWTWTSESGATPELLRAYVERAIAAAESGSALVWATTVLHAGGGPEIAGCTRLADLDMHHRRGEIGWTWVAPKYRGRGLNPRVKLLQMDYAFGMLGLRRVALKTHHQNLRSQGAMLKLGRTTRARFAATCCSRTAVRAIRSGTQSWTANGRGYGRACCFALERSRWPCSAARRTPEATRIAKWLRLFPPQRTRRPLSLHRPLHPPEIFAKQFCRTALWC